MDQDNSNSNTINFAAGDPAYAPINPQGPMPEAAPSPVGTPVQPTSVSDQIAAFGQAQQAVAELPMVPVETAQPVASATPAPQFTQPLPAQPAAVTPVFAQPVAPNAAAVETLAEPAIAPVTAPVPDSPVNDADVVRPASPTTEAKKSPIKTILILVVVFVLLFGLAMLIGYALGLKAGQASMPGM